MKVGVIISNLGLGGAQKVAMTLVKWMNNNGNDANLIVLKRLKNAAYTADVPYINISDSNAKILISLERHIRKENYELCVVMGVPLCVYAVPAIHLGAKNTKIVVSERNDPKHFAGKKVVGKLSRFFMKFADGFVFQTNDAKSFYSKYLGDRGVVIPNPIYNNELPDPFHGEKSKRIVSAGRLVKQKNFDILIKAFAEIHMNYPDYTLEIYGDGELKDDLILSAQKLGIEKYVSFPGTVVDVCYRIRDASVFVLSSDFEGMPNSLIEAMAMGLPCIATDCPCGGPKMIINNNLNGLLIKTGDIKGLVISLNKILSDNNFALNIGNNAEKIRETLDSDVICNDWYTYFEEVLN